MSHPRVNNKEDFGWGVWWWLTQNLVRMPMAILLQVMTWVLTISATSPPSSNVGRAWTCLRHQKI